jgi:predicted small secreted protein
MKKDFLITLILVVVTALSNGCVTAKAGQDMENSRIAYKKCLEEHPDDPDKCEALRRAFEADLNAYRATSPGITSHGAISVEQN